MDGFRVAVVGIGNMGLAHANCILADDIEGMSLVAVCDINKEKLSVFKGKHPSVEIYSDYSQLLANATIDGVIIATPHPLHSEMATEALKKGIHVLLEKPVDISVSKVKKLNEIATQTNAVFSMMFNQRTNPLFKKVREIVQSGRLGELKRTIWIVTNWYRTQSYYNSGEWRATWVGEGGGVLLNQAPHNLDLWQWICGMPVSVMAYCDVAKFHDIEVEDDATIFTRYKNGATGIFITSTGEYPGTNRLEISGDLGKIVLENGVLKWWKLKVSEREVCRTSTKGFDEIDYDYFEIKQEETETAHRGILQNFTNAVLYGEELIAPGVDGINELILSNAAYLSEWKDNQSISLPFDQDEFDFKLLEKVGNSKYEAIGQAKCLEGKYIKRWMVNW